jgi:hypothetical protein
VGSLIAPQLLFLVSLKFQFNMKKIMWVWNVEAGISSYMIL